MLFSAFLQLYNLCCFAPINIATVFLVKMRVGGIIVEIAVLHFVHIEPQEETLSHYITIFSFNHHRVDKMLDIDLLCKI